MLTALLSWEGSLLLLIQEYLRVPLLTAVLVPLTTICNHGELWIALSVLMLFFPKTRKTGVLALMSLLFCWLINNCGLKLLVARARPYTQIEGLVTVIAHPTDYSFPSGHTCSSFAAACTYWRGAKNRAFKIGMLALAGLVAFSRLYVGVHYPTDVLGGALVGWLGSGLVWRFLAGRYDARFPRQADTEYREKTD